MQDAALGARAARLRGGGRAARHAGGVVMDRSTPVLSCFVADETPKLFVKRPAGPGALAIDCVSPESCGRRARTQVTLRWRAVTLRRPGGEGAGGRVGGARGVEWLLLTSEPVRTQADAERMLLRYRLRWRIEDWHRVLKSGCKVQDLANRTRERLERATAINAVIGWRLHLMVLPRDAGAAGGDMFSDIELRVLHDFAQERGKPRPTDVGEAVLLVAVGGLPAIPAKHYAVPGAEIRRAMCGWRPWRRLSSGLAWADRALWANYYVKVLDVGQQGGPVLRAVTAYV